MNKFEGLSVATADPNPILKNPKSQRRSRADDVAEELA